MGVKSSAKTCKAIHQTLKNFNSFVANLVPCIKEDKSERENAYVKGICTSFGRMCGSTAAVLTLFRRKDKR
jgi:hypothetical protein